MSTIKAIETCYKGYRFRSRLEARWAIFFDAMGDQWEYEKEGFSLPSGPYLPDFWKPAGISSVTGEQYGEFVEIKGFPPTTQELYRIDQLGEMTGHSVILVHGDPGGFDCWRKCKFAAHLECHEFNQFWKDCFPDWNEARARAAFNEVMFRPHLGKGPVDTLNAIVASRSARFEHGETP